MSDSSGLKIVIALLVNYFVRIHSTLFDSCELVLAMGSTPGNRLLNISCVPLAISCKPLAISCNRFAASCQRFAASCKRFAGTCTLVLCLPLVALSADAPQSLSSGDSQNGAAHPDQGVISEQAIASLIQNVTVSANVAGLVRSVPIVEGEVVGVGELLVQMNDSAAKADYQAAQKAASAAELKASNDVNLRYAQRTMEVSQAEYQKSEAANRRHAGAVSDTELARLKLVVDQGRLQMEQAEFEQRVAKAEAQEKASLANAAKIRLLEHAIQSPVGGMVAELLVQAGQHIDAGQPLVRLIDLKSLRVECLVSEELAGGLKSGMPVAFRFEQDKSVTGQVDFVSPEVHPVTHEVRISARVANESLQLRPGTHGTLVLITAPEEP